MPSSRAKTRHRKVAQEFKKWLTWNPNADKKEKLKKFHQIADLAFERDRKAMEDEIKAA